jgi:hypothetical protein
MVSKEDAQPPAPHRRRTSGRAAHPCHAAATALGRGDGWGREGNGVGAVPPCHIGHGGGNRTEKDRWKSECHVKCLCENLRREKKREDREGRKESLLIDMWGPCRKGIWFFSICYNTTLLSPLICFSQFPITKILEKGDVHSDRDALRYFI